MSATHMNAIERVIGEGGCSDNSLTDSGSESGTSEKSHNGNGPLFNLPMMDPENHNSNGRSRIFRDDTPDRRRWPRRFDGREQNGDGSESNGRSQSAPVVRFASQPNVVQFEKRAPVSERFRNLRDRLPPPESVSYQSNGRAMQRRDFEVLASSGELTIADGIRKEIGNFTDPRVLRKMSDEFLVRAKAIEEEKAQMELEEKVAKFSSENKKALGRLLDDCYICTEPLLKGLGVAGDFGIAAWKCGCTCWRVAHNSCLASKLVSNGDICDFCRSQIQMNGLPITEEEEEPSYHTRFLEN